MARNRGCGITRNDWKSGCGKRGKGPVGAVPCARATGGYDSEMVSSPGSQAADERTNTLERVPSLSMWGSRESVVGRCSILKIHGGGQSVRVNGAVKCC